MKKVLTCEFLQTMDAHKMHKETLSQKSKKLSETYYEYIYQMFEISKEVEDSAIIKYIIDGIQDEEINKTMYGAKNIPKLKEKFMLYTQGYEGEYESERQAS